MEPATHDVGLTGSYKERQTLPDLAGFTLSDMVTCSAAVRRAGSDARSFEEVAQRTVRWLYEELRGPEGRNCVLVRFYKTHPYGHLDESLRAAARRSSSGSDIAASTPCLTLLATAGDEPEWNDRHRSVNHRAIPLPSEEVLNRSPMIAQLVRQLGVDAASLIDPPPGAVPDVDEKDYDVFYVPDATDSTHIPDQAFVGDHGVRSVLGFGGLLPTGDLFSVILFSRVPIAPTTTTMFGSVSLSTKVAVLPFLGGPLFTGGVPGAGSAVDGVGRHSATVDRLLELQEQVALEQSSRLDEALAAERRRSAQLEQLAKASLLINSTLSIDEVVERVTEQARSIIGAHQSVASLTVDQNWAQAITSVSLSEKYAAWQDYVGLPDGSGIYASVCESNRSANLSQDELEAHPRWRGLGAAAAEHPPMRGWLAAPLVGRTGENLGLLQLSDPYAERFTPADEAILVQLAALTAVSVENARRFTHEHNVSVALQRSLLPEALPQVPRLEVGVRYLPATEGVSVGGDWYDVLLVGDHHALLVIGDVVGHDLAAAKTMGQLRHAIAAFASDDPAPRSVLRRLARVLATREDECFATLAYLLLDLTDGRLRYINAGHPAPAWRHADGPAELLPAPPHPPVGSVADPEYQEAEAVLRPGDALVLYTDGLVERRGENLELGFDRLRETTAASGNDTCEETLIRLEGLLAPGDRADDVAILVACWTGPE